MWKRSVAARMLLAVLLVLAGPPAAAQSADKEKAMRPEGGETAHSPTGETIAILHTSLGKITLGFFPDRAPAHVENFLELARSGFYDGTLFHRVIPGYMIQGGDPNSKDDDPANDGFGDGPRLLKAEFNSIPHTRGIVSMARRSGLPDSASCQFFILQGDNRELDGQYTVFGRVLEGLPVVDRIAAAPRTTDGRDRPLQDIVIQRVEIGVR